MRQEGQCIDIDQAITDYLENCVVECDQHNHVLSAPGKTGNVFRGIPDHRHRMGTNADHDHDCGQCGGAEVQFNYGYIDENEISPSCTASDDCRIVESCADNNICTLAADSFGEDEGNVIRNGILYQQYLFNPTGTGIYIFLPMMYRGDQDQYYVNTGSLQGTDADGMRQQRDAVSTRTGHQVNTNENVYIGRSASQDIDEAWSNRYVRTPFAEHKHNVVSSSNRQVSGSVNEYLNPCVATNGGTGSSPTSCDFDDPDTDFIDGDTENTVVVCNLICTVMVNVK